MSDKQKCNIGDRVSFVFFGGHTGTVIKINPKSVVIIDDCSGSRVPILFSDFSSRNVTILTNYEAICKNSCVHHVV